MTTLANPSSTTSANAPVNGTTQACNLKRVIVIDPGHGGTVGLQSSTANNATSVSGELEKTLTLEYGLSLRTALQSAEVKAILTSRNICDLKVVMTRTTDVNLAAPDRLAVATANKADIFISLHFNGLSPRSTRRTEVFYRSSHNSDQTNLTEDRQLAQIVQDAAVQAMRTFDTGAHAGGPAKDDTQSGPKMIWVLRDPGIGLSGQMGRSCLLEIEVITNPDVERNLITGPDRAAHRETITMAIAKALARAV